MSRIKLIKNILPKIQLSMFALVCLVLLCNISIVAAQEGQRDNQGIKVFEEDFEMVKGESLQAEIKIRDIYAKLPTLDTSRHLIAIDVQSTVTSEARESLHHLVDVSTYITNSNLDEEIDIKDSIYRTEEDDYVLHYISYRLKRSKIKI